MNEFFWIGGHFGWIFFSCGVITATWWLVGDALWRLKRVALKWFLFSVATGWVCSIVVCMLVWLAVGNA